jgi:WD40 repeat protein
MRNSLFFFASWLTVPSWLFAVGTEPPAPPASNPLKVTTPNALPCDQKDLPKGASMRFGSSSLPRGLEGNFSFSPDGKFLAVGKANRTAEVVEVDTGKVVHTFGPFERTGLSSRNMAGAFFSPDGATVAVACAMDVHLFDAKSGKAIGKLRGHEHIIEAVDFSLDGKHIVTGSFDQSIVVWDRKSLGQLNKFSSMDGSIQVVALAPDSSAVARADYNGIVRIWSLPAGKPLHEPFRLKSLPQVLRFVDAKTLLAVGMETGLVSWDLQTGKEKQRIPQIKGSVTISPDGKLLLAGLEDLANPKIELWDRESGKSIRKITGSPAQTYNLAIASDNQSFASYGHDGVMRRWKLPSGEEIKPPQGHQHHVSGVAFTGDGKTLISSSEDGTVRFWDLATGRETRQLSAKNEYFHAMAISSDGKTLALSGDNFARRWYPVMGEDRQSANLRFWDIQAGKEVSNYYRTGSSPVELRFTADNSKVLARDSTKVWLIDVKTGKEKAPIPAADQGMPAADLSPDGRYLATSTDVPALRQIGKIAYFDLIEGKETFSKTFYLGGYSGLAFNPDGNYLAVGSSRGYREDKEKTSPLQLWAVPTEKVVRQFEITGQYPTHLTFSRDGRLLAAVEDNQILVFEVATGKLRRSYSGHELPIRCVAFSRDGRRLASGGQDSRVFIWDNTGLRGKGPFTKLDPKEMDRLWSGLSSDSASIANEALWELVARPQESIGYMKTRLTRLDEDEMKRIDKLVNDLDSDRFKVRDQAAKELERIGESAVPSLSRALAHKSQEVSEAAKRLLEKIGTGEDPASSPDLRRMVRAVEVLEQIGNADAKALVKELQQRGNKVVLHREAAAALKRME